MRIQNNIIHIYHIYMNDAYSLIGIQYMYIKYKCINT